MELEARCPPYPDELTQYPAPPVFAPQMPWNKWADANQEWGIALADRITRQKKWRADKWKNCPFKF